MRKELERHLQNPAFRGIRYQLARRRVDVEKMKLPNFIANFELLNQLGLTFDLMCHQYQLKDAAELARKYPKVHVVLDHLACPVMAAKNKANVEEWIEGMKDLASYVVYFSGNEEEDAPDMY